MFSRSLDIKILALLTLSVAAVTAVIIYITTTSLSRRILDEFVADSKNTMSVVASGIKQTMASGNSRLIENQLLDIKSENRDMELFIVDTDQKIIFSSDERALQRSLHTELLNKDLNEALKTGFQTGHLPDRIFEERHHGERFFMHAHLMHNESQCYSCHGSQKQFLGAVVLRKPIEKSYAAIKELRNNNIRISIIGIVAIIFLAHVLIRKAISLPIKRLSRDIAEFPEKIADNSIVEHGEIKRDDEIGDLQRAFHNMAIDLYEKNHAVQKSNMDLLNANKELESFAYSVSHDLRAPLRNIDGFSKILMDDFAEALPDKAKHYLKRVRNATVKMSMLIDDILTFSRIGRTDIDFKKVPCSAIVKSVLGNFTEEIERRGVQVTIEDLPEINCDTTLMQSLYLNFISNALKFTRNVEKPEITIGYDRLRKLFFVRDNGVGFDMQYHAKIFQVFQRLHLPEEYEGTGIGLAIVKRIAERHHGKVWAESEPGRGATFFLDLPTF